MEARHVVLQGALFVMLDDVLFYYGTKRDIHRVAVPKYLCHGILEENHRNLIGG